MFLSTHLFIHPSIHSSIYPSIHPPSYSSFHPCIHPSIHPCIHLSTQLFILLTWHPSFYASIHVSVLLSIYTPIHPCIHLSIHIPIYPSISLLLHLFVVHLTLYKVNIIRSRILTVAHRALYSFPFNSSLATLPSHSTIITITLLILKHDPGPLRLLSLLPEILLSEPSQDLLLSFTRTLPKFHHFQKAFSGHPWYKLTTPCHPLSFIPPFNFTPCLLTLYHMYLFCLVSTVFY